MRRVIAIAYSVLFTCLGVFLFQRSLPLRTFTEEAFVYDLIWLDAWVLSFFFLIVLLWNADISRRLRSVLSLVGLSVFGFVGVLIYYAGGEFGWNGYGGDQLLRLAMVTKFVEVEGFADFFYKGLTPFYPPVYYWSLSVVSRLFDIVPHEMLKFGNAGIYLVMPLPLYLLWRKLVTPFQAALAVFANFLLLSFGYPYLHSAPHAFLANSFFVPWWLHYVEQVNAKRIDWKFYLIGCLIGGTLFMTYYFPFFVGGLMLAVRLIGGWHFRSLVISRRFRWKVAIGMLGLSAIVSMPFWGPLIWTMVSTGSDASQQSWHHGGTTGVSLRLIDFSIDGVLFLVAFLWAARRYYVELSRGFVQMIGATVLFLLIGSILGAVDRPVNLIKVREFAAVIGTPFIGLFLASIVRGGVGQSRRRGWRVAVVFLVLLFCLNGFQGMAKSKVIKRGRTSIAPDFKLNLDLLPDWNNAVVLSGHSALYSFEPVNAFLFANHHYSHPAAQYTARFEFLDALTRIEDPYLFWLAMRYNKFDQVDYLMFANSGGMFSKSVLLSNYPNRYTERTLQFFHRPIADTNYFRPAAGRNLYRVIDTPPESRPTPGAAKPVTIESQLKWDRSVDGVALGLNETGLKKFLEYADKSLSSINQLSRVVKLGTGSDIYLSGLRSIRIGDTLCILTEFEFVKGVNRDLRVFCHVYDGEEADVFSNYDFALDEPTLFVHAGSWCSGVVRIVTGRDPVKIHFGLFDAQGRLGGEYQLTL